MGTKIDSIQDRYITLYADCFAVQGACKSAIYDLTRREIVRFPSVYLEILREATTATVDTVLARAEDAQTRQQMTDFFELLLEKEFINISDVATQGWPDIKEVWNSPSEIQNAIIDVKDEAHDFETLFGQLDKLGCEVVQIRCFTHLHTLDDMRRIVNLARHTSIQGVELLLKYDPRCAEGDYLRFVEQMSIVSRLTIHSSPAEKELVTAFGDGSETQLRLEKKVSLIRDRITSEHHCGVIHAGNVTPPSTALFFENRLHNGCLNKKLSIDSQGFIRNCPSMRTSFGHHRQTGLMNVARDVQFQSAWHIKKDMIKQCQDCEFRYACTDCRAYLQDPRDALSKPLKCGYDPYTGTWDNWDAKRSDDWVVTHYGTDGRRL